MKTSDARIERALNGDAAAAAELVESLLPIIRKRVTAALLRGRDRIGRSVTEEAGDLTQEVLLALFRDDGRILRAWQPERGLTLEQFVGFIARRHVLSTLRNRQRNPFEMQPIDPAELEAQPASGGRRDAHGSTESRQSLERLTAALGERLSPAGLEMFRRLFVEEESVRDVSQSLGLTPECVYQWRTRIKKAALELRSSLG